MKTKAKSYRFEENDLALAMAKSGIKKTQKLMDFLLSEYVRDLKPEYLSLPKDYVSFTNVKAITPNGDILDITEKPTEFKGIIASVKEQYKGDFKNVAEEEVNLARLEMELSAIPDKTKGLGKKRAEYLEKRIKELKNK